MAHREWIPPWSPTPSSPPPPRYPPAMHAANAVTEDVGVQEWPPVIQVPFSLSPQAPSPPPQFPPPMHGGAVRGPFGVEENVTFLSLRPSLFPSPPPVFLAAMRGGAFMGAAGGEENLAVRQSPIPTPPPALMAARRGSAVMGTAGVEENPAVRALRWSPIPSPPPPPPAFSALIRRGAVTGAAGVEETAAIHALRRSPIPTPPPPPPLPAAKRGRADTGGLRVQENSETVRREVVLALPAPGGLPDVPAKRPRGRPPGSGNLQQLASIGGVLAETARGDFTTHVVIVQRGEDLMESLLDLLEGSRGICIISATGSLTSVCIAPSAGDIPLRVCKFEEGPYEILSLRLRGTDASVSIPTERRHYDMFNVLVAEPHGVALAGVVMGPMIASTPIQIVLGSFSEEVHDDEGKMGQ